MKLTQCTWWRFPEVRSFDRRWLDKFYIEGVRCWNIDGREEWFIFEDGTGMFALNDKDEPVIKTEGDTEFNDMVEYIHREDWVDWVLDEMEYRLENMIDTGEIEDKCYPEVTDAAYEWLPYVLPNTYAKVFPSKELLDKLTHGFFIEEADPQTTTYE